MKQALPLWVSIALLIAQAIANHYRTDGQVKDLQDQINRTGEAAEYANGKADVTAEFVRHAINIADGKTDCSCAESGCPCKKEELERLKRNGVVPVKPIGDLPKPPPLPKPDPNPRPRPPHPPKGS